VCLSCGCVLAGSPDLADDDHGDPRQITLSGLVAAADANGISPAEVAATIGTSLQVAQPEQEVAKSGEPDRFVLGVAYQPGRDPKIAKGQDGGRDYLTEAELEKAAWSFMLHGQQHGMFHVDGTEDMGLAQPVENGIYRNPIPWVVPSPSGPPVIVRKGTWLIGSLLNDRAWQMHLDGKVGGWSPQGRARRRRPAA
jgi:hypothetical protein